MLSCQIRLASCQQQNWIIPVPNDQCGLHPRKFSLESDFGYLQKRDPQPIAVSERIETILKVRQTPPPVMTELDKEIEQPVVENVDNENLEEEEETNIVDNVEKIKLEDTAQNRNNTNDVKFYGSGWD